MKTVEKTIKQQSFEIDKINAAHNIKDRFKDKEITLYTSYKKVKEVLANRKIRLA